MNLLFDGSTTLMPGPALTGQMTFTSAQRLLVVAIGLQVALALPSLVALVLDDRLLNGVSAGTSAGDTVADIIADVQTLLSAFGTDAKSEAAVLAINPVRAVALSQLPRPLPVDLIISSNVATDEVHAIGAADFCTATDAPRMTISEPALHMSDSPGEIVEDVTPPTEPTISDPVRSMFQTHTYAVRLILPVSWGMRRADQVASLSSVSW